MARDRDVPAIQRRRNSGVLRENASAEVHKRRVSTEPWKENASVEARKVNTLKEAQKENIPLEVIKEPLRIASTKADAGVEKERRPRHRVGEVLRPGEPFQELSGKSTFNKAGGFAPTAGNAPPCHPAALSSLPVFVDAEFEHHDATPPAGSHRFHLQMTPPHCHSRSPEEIAAPEFGPEVLAGFTNDHQATVQALARRLDALRTFKAYLAAGDVRAARSTMSSCQDCWSQRDIKRFQLLLENVKPSIGA